MPRSFLLFALLLCARAWGKSECDAAVQSPRVVELPGHPFRVIGTSDGCHLFVSIMGQGPDQKSGIAILRLNAGVLAVSRRPRSV
jgi:hypothetical protein